MNSKLTNLIAERAHALAIVHLTRRDDLRINKHDRSRLGVEYIIEILRDGRPTGRIWGLNVLGRDVPVPSQGFKDASSLRVPVRDWMDAIPFPLCVFFFSMQHDDGYYTWLKEPMVGEDGFPQLRLNKNGEIMKLDLASLNEIVKQVNLWYDARAKRLAA